MPNSPELPQLVAQTFRSEPNPDRRQSQQFDVFITQYKNPKEIVFRENADVLSPREQEMMELVIDGRSNKEIADEVIISQSTVRIHLNNIADKVDDGFNLLGVELPAWRSRIWKINALLQLGELELRDPELNQTKA